MASRTVLLIGANGQLGHDILQVWPDACPSDRVVPLTHSDIEVASARSVQNTLAEHHPDVVINTSAYHRVDIVEDEPGRAFEVNSTGPHNLALACADLGAVLIHLSTDYVFSGRGRARGEPYAEKDSIEPLNVYGVSKAAGEMFVRYCWQRHFLVRVSGLYGVAGSSGKGGNFVETMLRLAGTGNPIRVVDDQVLTPTHTLAVARQLATLSNSDAYGTYHATCQGECSWFEFAAEIFRLAGLSPHLGPQSTAEAGNKARRPSYSALDNRNLRSLEMDCMPDWRDALGEYLAMRAVAR
jgi:dTDP-4-dehydrorhamnose reductase